MQNYRYLHAYLHRYLNRSYRTSYDSPVTAAAYSTGAQDYTDTSDRQSRADTDRRADSKCFDNSYSGVSAPYKSHLYLDHIMLFPDKDKKI